jgi:hypothetical protein
VIEYAFGGMPFVLAGAWPRHLVLKPAALPRKDAVAFSAKMGTILIYGNAMVILAGPGLLLLPIQPL